MATQSTISSSTYVERIQIGPYIVIKSYRKITQVSQIGQHLKSRRRTMKLSQQAFADLAGVGRRFISELEAGKPTVEFERVLKVCSAAGIDILAAARSEMPPASE
jgi:y4mF family transcriptional regulator